MHVLCVYGAVNMQGFVWKFFLNIFYALYINFHSFVHSHPRLAKPFSLRKRLAVKK